MSNIIGYKGTSKERAIAWNAMLMLKEGYNTFRNSKEESLLKIALEDKEEYTKYLSRYKN